MGYFIPIDRVYQLLEQNDYQFIYDDSYSKDDCQKARCQDVAVQLCVYEFHPQKHHVIRTFNYQPIRIFFSCYVVVKDRKDCSSNDE